MLTLKQRAYVQVARLSGMGSIEIIFKELMPNLLSYLAAATVSAVSAAILASIGLEALGLGPMDVADAGHDDLLGHLLRRTDQRLVVVVVAADRPDLAAVHRAVPGLAGA